MAESTESTLKKMGKKQKEFLIVLSENAGMIAKAAKKFHINRQTVYNWKKQYEGFAEEIEMIDESMIDFAESALFTNIKNLDTTSILFYLKCKGKKRGYVERQEIEHRGEMGIEINITGSEDD